MKKRKLTPLGVAIKKALIDRDMPQVELADSLNMSPKYLHLILYGERSGKKYLRKIGVLLDIELENYLETA